MTITRRRLLAAAGGAAAASGLAACSGAPPAPASASPSASPSAAPSVAGAAAHRPPLAVWHRPTGEDGAERALRRWAAAYPAATVTLTAPAEYERTTAAALGTASGPDVFEWTTGPTVDMVRAGLVADLTEVVGAARADFAPRLIDRLTDRGGLWAVPQRLDVQVLYYRRSLLAKAGLEPPTTLPALVTAADALASAGRGGLYAGADGGLAVLGGLLIWAAGLDQVAPDGTSAGFDDPALDAAVASYRTLLAAPGLLRTASTDWSDATPFIENECALQWGGLWDLTRVLAAHAGDVGVLPFPAAGAGGRQVVPVTASCVCVSARAADPAAASAYVRSLWVDDEAKQIEYAGAHGVHVPAKPKLFGLASRVATGAGAEAARFATELGHTDDLRWTPACATAFATALGNVVRANRDPRTEFRAAAATVAAELERVAG